MFLSPDVNFYFIDKNHIYNLFDWSRKIPCTKREKISQSFTWLGKRKYENCIQSQEFDAISLNYLVLLYNSLTSRRKQSYFLSPVGLSKFSNFSINFLAGSLPCFFSFFNTETVPSLANYWRISGWEKCSK